jgi:deazaflavin-dependent oxidoreductase (nitroreductase family)
MVGHTRDVYDIVLRKISGGLNLPNLPVMRDSTAKRLSKLHTSLYRITGGRIGRRLVNNDMLLLATTGRKSGTKHTVPLLYLADNEDIVVIASWGGRDDNPDWYKNLESNPEAEVQINSDRFDVRATVAGPERRARLWPQILEAYDGYREYQDRTHRQIPVVTLEQNERT